MLNIFPRAQPAAIEEMIGMSMPSARVPDSQPSVEPLGTRPLPSIKPFKPQLPPYFEEQEIRLFPEPNYSAVKTAILHLYLSSGNRLTLSSCFGLCNFSYLIRVFNFLEDNNLINYATDTANSLYSALNSANPIQPDNPINHPNTEWAHASIERTHSSIERMEGKQLKHKYVEPEQLINSSCLCGMPATKFTSDFFFICDICFNSGKYPSFYTFRNFHIITKQLTSSIWTREEEYQLLKNIEQYGDEWNRVAAATGKSIEQCIFHFIKMPLMDGCSTYPILPFTTVPNQISTFISYVAYMAHPGIAAEMAKATIKYMERPNIMEILMGVAAKKGKEILELEKRKKERIKKVKEEAMIRILLLKVDAISEMYNEGMAVKSELEIARAKLLEESKELQN